MIIYNVTVNIEESIQKEWLTWMQETHIPEVMNTGMFISAKMTRVLVEEQMGGITYSTQYSCESKAKLDEYQVKFAPQLQQEYTKKYQGKFVAFRTLLEVISEF
ncbi:MAG: DUF4286 family protein [Flavobacteriales bacterium]|nr:DUF4286 family protein [Flavobacteriales bacterium]